MVEDPYYRHVEERTAHFTKAVAFLKAEHGIECGEVQPTSIASIHMKLDPTDTSLFSPTAYMMIGLVNGEISIGLQDAVDHKMIDSAILALTSYKAVAFTLRNDPRFDALCAEAVQLVERQEKEMETYNHLKEEERKALAARLVADKAARAAQAAKKEAERLRKAEEKAQRSVEEARDRLNRANLRLESIVGKVNPSEES